MQEWLGTNDILRYLTDNKGDSVIAKIFIKRLKDKINKKWQIMIANLFLVIWID